MEWKNIDTGNICPVCGFILDFKAWVKGSDSQEICPSCGTQFGYYDASSTSDGVIKRWQELREKWIKNGMKFKHSQAEFNEPPANWNPQSQLKNIPKEYLLVQVS